MSRKRYYAGRQGKQGPQGIPGPEGPQGLQGIPGPAGPPYIDPAGLDELKAEVQKHKRNTYALGAAVIGMAVELLNRIF